MNFIATIQNQEGSTVTALENSVDLLISSLNSCIAKVGLNQGAIANYKSNSFYTDKDVYTLANISQVFYQQYEDNKDIYEAMLEAEQDLEDAAEERETQGVWKTVGGVVLVGVGVACIIATAGAASPIVAAVGVAVGTGTTIFGAADSAEGAQDIYYGSIGDIDSTAVNDLKDVVFQGNEEAYYLTESVFAFAASAMIPIGQAASAGNLTFRSGATIVAKEEIATAAGAGAQKYTTDLTGNQTAGMIAGMAASMATAKGLNGIEAGAKKLAKPKLGDVGADGGAVLNDADVGSAVKSGSSSVQHAVGSANQAQSVLDGINPKYFNPESRFGGGFYVGADADTIVAELAEHGNTAKYAISYDMNLSGQKVLDLTNPQIASEWGYVQNLTSTKACQNIGEIARTKGYNVIKFQSYRGDGINYVIYNDFENILSPRNVTPVD